VSARQRMDRPLKVMVPRANNIGQSLMMKSKCYVLAPVMFVLNHIWS
jgi:hypothetical protein